ncbi:DIP1984 family protein [Rhodococcus sp. NPDC049939]|uniref:DIP1984 family protein n=1 Tax=Rhodococcus sp. NPDC049939 TaxID=3155511 RepID=UPI00340963B8
MKLAEALAERGDLNRRVEQLNSRILTNARHQEGESPAEDAASLLLELEGVLDRMEVLVRRINRTNAAAPLGDASITDALARRDMLRIRHRVVSAAADAASGREQDRYGRQLRSELVFVAALPVSDLRRTADDLAQRIRGIDLQVQKANWEVELLD